MKHDANTACQFESIFMCSGWSSSCTSNTTFSGNCPNCEIIVGKGQYSQYSCSSVFESRVSEEFKWLMLGGCIAIGVIALLNFMAFCAAKRFSWVDLESEEQPPYEAVDQCRPTIVFRQEYKDGGKLCFLYILFFALFFLVEPQSRISGGC